MIASESGYSSRHHQAIDASHVGELSLQKFIAAEQLLEPVSRLSEHGTLAEAATSKARDERAEVVKALADEVASLLL